MYLRMRNVTIWKCDNSSKEHTIDFSEANLRKDIHSGTEIQSTTEETADMRFHIFLQMYIMISIGSLY